MLQSRVTRSMCSFLLKSVSSQNMELQSSWSNKFKKPKQVVKSNFSIGYCTLFFCGLWTVPIYWFGTPSCASVSTKLSTHDMRQKLSTVIGTTKICATLMRANKPKTCRDKVASEEHQFQCICFIQWSLPRLLAQDSRDFLLARNPSASTHKHLVAKCSM